MLSSRSASFTALACEALMLKARGKPIRLFLTDLSALVTAWRGQGGVAVGSELSGQRLFAGRRDGVLTMYRQPL